MDLTQYFLQYGLAGIVIYIFYKLMSNELKELREEIKRFRKTVFKLYVAVKKLNKKS